MWSKFRSSSSLILERIIERSSPKETHQDKAERALLYRSEHKCIFSYIFLKNKPARHRSNVKNHVSQTQRGSVTVPEENAPEKNARDKAIIDIFSALEIKVKSSNLKTGSLFHSKVRAKVKDKRYAEGEQFQPHRNALRLVFFLLVDFLQFGTVLLVLYVCSKEPIPVCERRGVVSVEVVVVEVVIS